MNTDVPIISIIGTIILCVILLSLVSGYVVMQKMHYFFIPLIVGVLFYLVMGVDRMIRYRDGLKKAVAEREAVDDSFTTCPDYWTANHIDKKKMCYNNFDEMYIGKTNDNPIQNESIMLDDLNNMTKAERCEKALDYAWVEAVNKCN